jgi:predicted nucleotidyltransferase
MAHPVISLDDLRRKRQAILAVAERRGAHDLRVFGSVASGTETAESDVDFVARFGPERSLFDLGGLKADLEDLLGCPVDVLSEGGLRPEFREAVLRQAVAL